MVLEAERFKIEAWARRFFSEAAFSQCPHCGREKANKIPGVLFFSEAHESYQMSTQPLSPHLILITPVETLCPKRIVLEVGASTYEFWYVLGGGSQPLSA